MSRLFQLENSGQAEQRTELGGERFLSLIHDPDSARAYVFSHGTDVTEGAEIPPGTEFWEYPTQDEAARAYRQLLAESAGDVVEEDSEEGLGDSESAGAEVRDRYSASDEDDLVNVDTEESVDDLK